MLEEIVVTEAGDPPQIVLKLHWAAGVHTELSLRKNQTGQHGRVNSEEVIDVIRELSPACDDATIVGTLNRLGYRTGNNNTWNEKRLQYVRHSQNISPCPPEDQRDWVTMSRAAHLLTVSLMVIRRLIAEQVLPARQVAKSAPWIIKRADLDLPEVRKQIRRVIEARRVPLIAPDDAQTSLFVDFHEV